MTTLTICLVSGGEITRRCTRQQALHLAARFNAGHVLELPLVEDNETVYVNPAHVVSLMITELPA